jgi:GR25 family glycosyltransferase involved in LPS biosynthesis
MRIKAYVVHSTKMDIRKSKMDDLANTLSGLVSFEYITQHDAIGITQKDIAEKIRIEPGNDKFDGLLKKNMHINQVSNILKHSFALEKAVSEKAEYDFFLFLEDDVLYTDNAKSQIENICKEMVSRPDVEIVMLGVPTNDSGTREDVVFKSTLDLFPILPCCDSYLISSRSVERIGQLMSVYKFPTNIQLSYVAFKNDFVIHMTVPNVFLDGSKFGVYLSEVDANSKLIFNPEYNRLDMLVGSYKGPNTSVEIDEMLDTIKFKNHPDVLHIKAKYLIKQQNYKAAESILDNIYNIVNQNGCVINNSTEFMKTYIKLHQYIQ